MRGWASRRRVAGFATREEQIARRHGSVLPYFRLEDSLCRRFLELASDPYEFQGLKLLFPFVRELSVLQVPRDAQLLPRWMYLAFVAGHDFGRAHPERLDDVLPGRELREAAKRLGIISNCSGEEHLTAAGLQQAFKGIAETKWGNVPAKEFGEALLEAVVKCLRTGFAAATVARCDPQRCELVWDIPESIGNACWDILNRLLAGTMVDALGKPVSELFEHPLLKLGRELYPEEPTERDTVLEFLRGRLRSLKVRSEAECPCSEMDLLDWIAAGINYGRRVKQERPEIVARIFEESDEEQLEVAKSVVRRVVVEAGGTDPGRLLAPLKRWQERVYGWSEPEYYGERLARVVYVTDFAVWIPWTTDGTQFGASKRAAPAEGRA